MLSFKYNTVGEVWLQSLYQVMTIGISIKDTGAKLHKLGIDIITDNTLNNDNLKRAYDPVSQSLAAINIKEVQNLYFSISSIDENSDEIIQKFADKSRIEYLKQRYGASTADGYGSRIYGQNGINQYQWLYDHLYANPETKSATITLMEPCEDKPPCLSLLDFKYRNGSLNMTIVYRSQNVFLNQPGNLIALRELQCNLAKNLGYVAGSVEVLVISAHIYELNYSEAMEILRRTGYLQS